ncbi:MAG TPA: NAD(P)-binding protein [Actinomycetota bacterium]|nr:NAD(P)-binding protein [Actinomycetota bacterium]
MGREDGISRRDFLEGILIAAGGAAVLASSPMRALAHYPPGTTFPPDGTVGLDPRVTRGGNLRAAFTSAHWLRDERLTWSTNSVTVAPSSTGVDTTSGTFTINDDTASYDLIVVGGGIGGFSTAFFANRAKPRAKILILEANATPGGNAGRDDASPALPVKGATGAAYLVYPYDTFLFDFYDGIGLEWADWLVADPGYNYYFDSAMPQTSRDVWNGATGWVNDVYNTQGIDSLPFSAAVRQQFHQAKQDFRNWYNTNGSPTDPPDNSDPKYDYLAHKSLREYLTVDRGFHSAVADFYDQYASDALASYGAYANAYSAVSFLGAEYFPSIAFPGGNSYVIRRAIKKLIPNAIAGKSFSNVLNNPIDLTAADANSNTVRFRGRVTVLRVDQTASGATVYYHRDGAFYRATCKAVVLAGQMHTSHRMTEHMMGAEQLDAARAYRHIPVPIANVAVNNSRFLVDSGAAYDYYWYGSRYWQDAVVADWPMVGNDEAARNDGSRANVLTFYSGYFHDPATTRRQERVALLQTPFSEYEASLREDMTRVWGSSGFVWDRDVTAVYLYRWGHGMVHPYVGWTFGQPTVGAGGQVVRTPSDRHRARAQLGRVSFAAQDSEGAPAIEDAIFSGFRSANEAAAYL